MSTSERPLVYLIFGTPGSGRRELLADLISDGLAEGDRALTALSEAEADSEHDSRLGTVVRWTWTGGLLNLELPESDPEGKTPGFSHVFVVADGRSNPVDLIESFKPWLATQDAELGRILTVVDCTLAHRHHTALLPWFDACIHFSDVVLLTRREGVPNKWISDFQARYRDKYYPALFEFVKQGKVKNPPLVLEPQARRMTQIFEDDLDRELARNLAPDAVLEFSGDDEEDEEGVPSPDEPDEPVVDPYFERRQNGRRVIDVPDIRPFLAPQT